MHPFCHGSDEEMGSESLVKEAMSKNDVERVYGDGSYDSRANFNLLAVNGIDPAI